MASSSINIREIGENDCLFCTMDHADGSVVIGTNFQKETGFRLSHYELAKVLAFIRRNMEMEE